MPGEDACDSHILRIVIHIHETRVKLAGSHIDVSSPLDKVEQVMDGVDVVGVTLEEELFPLRHSQSTSYVKIQKLQCAE